MSKDAIQIKGITKSPFGLSFNTEKGDQYVIESTLDFDKWNTVETIEGTGQTVKFVELREIYYPQQYYRVRLNGVSGTVEFDLTAAPTSIRLRPDGPVTKVWAFNGTVPGPTLRTKVGDKMVINFRNDLPEPTTIHWHGLRIVNSMDGVPVVMNPIQPGESFRYEFIVPDAGTFWYHPHVNTAHQVDRGLYGGFVVEEAIAPSFHDEDYWVIDDWHLDDDNQYIEASVTEDFWGRSAGQFTLNGEFKPVISGIAGEHRRVRVLNSSNNTIISLKIDNHQLRIIAKDGTPVDEPWQTSSVRLATGERVDIDLKLTGKPNSDYTVRLEAFSNMFGPAGREVNKEARWTINDWSFPDYEDMHFDMGTSRLIEISNNTPMSHPFHLHGHFFRVVGRSKRGTPPSGGGSKQVMLATLRYGQGRAETLDEPSLPSHGIPSADQTKSLSTPMILGTSGVGGGGGGMGGGGMGGGDNTPVALTKRDKRSWQDTVEVPPSQTVQLLLLADNPGDWMYHCHILEHEESGMMGVFRVGAKP